MKALTSSKVCSSLRALLKARSGTPAASNFARTARSDRRLMLRQPQLDHLLCVINAPHEAAVQLVGQRREGGVVSLPGERVGAPAESSPLEEDHAVGLGAHGMEGERREERRRGRR